MCGGVDDVFVVVAAVDIDVDGRQFLGEVGCEESDCDLHVVEYKML